MTLEVELKAPAPRGIEARLRAAGAKKRSAVTNKDTFYDLPGEPLRKKGATLRIRRQGKKTILTYKSRSRSKTVKAKEETELTVDPSIAILLKGLGYVKTFEKETRRTEYGLGGVTVCVDRVKGLGNWVEFEVFGAAGPSRKKIVKAASKLGIPESQLVTSSYVAMLREKLNKSKKRKKR